MVIVITSSNVLASKTAIFSTNVTTTDRLFASTSQTGFLNFMLFTCSLVFKEMKLMWQNCGPGPAESQIATIGRFASNGSTCSSSVFGFGRIRRVRTTPCRHDKTSVASPVAAISQTYMHKLPVITTIYQKYECNKRQYLYSIWNYREWIT